MFGVGSLLRLRVMLCKGLLENGFEVLMVECMIGVMSRKVLNIEICRQAGRFSWP